MDWNFYWTIFLQVGLFAICFPIFCFPFGMGLYYIVSRVRKPTHLKVLQGTRNND